MREYLNANMPYSKQRPPLRAGQLTDIRELELGTVVEDHFGSGGFVELIGIMAVGKRYRAPHDPASGIIDDPNYMIVMRESLFRDLFPYEVHLSDVGVIPFGDKWNTSNYLSNPAPTTTAEPS